MRLGGQSFLNFFFRSRLLEGLEGGNDGTRKVASSSSKMSCSATSSSFFRVNEAAGTVEVDEGSGNAFHLGPILRKYTAAKLTVMPGRRLTTVELSRETTIPAHGLHTTPDEKCCRQAGDKQRGNRCCGK